MGRREPQLGSTSENRIGSASSGGTARGPTAPGRAAGRPDAVTGLRRRMVTPVVLLMATLLVACVGGSSAGNVAPSEKLTITTGSTLAGDRWSLHAWNGGDGGVCLELRQVACGPLPDDDRPLTARVESVGDRPTPAMGCAAGAVTEQATAVQLGFRGGPVELLIPHQVEELGTSVYGFCWSESRGPVTTTVLGPERAELVRIGPAAS